MTGTWLDQASGQFCFQISEGHPIEDFLTTFSVSTDQDPPGSSILWAECTMQGGASEHKGLRPTRCDGGVLPLEKTSAYQYVRGLLSAQWRREEERALAERNVCSARRTPSFWSGGDCRMQGLSLRLHSTRACAHPSTTPLSANESKFHCLDTLISMTEVLGVKVSAQRRFGPAYVLQRQDKRSVHRRLVPTWNDQD